eukprot:8043646-Alexandrium_andersonii.AAC.1
MPGTLSAWRRRRCASNPASSARNCAAGGSGLCGAAGRSASLGWHAATAAPSRSTSTPHTPLAE